MKISCQGEEYLLHKSSFVILDSIFTSEKKESNKARERAMLTPQLIIGGDTMSNDLKCNHLDGALGVTSKIKQAMYDAAKQFVYIGFLLWEVQEYGYYSEKGYKNVYEYAAQELGFKSTTTKNMIAINYNFGCKNEKEKGGIANHRTMSLQPAYEKFNYSQLTEMLSMSEKQRAQVTPDMSIRKIREIKKDEKIDFKTLDTIIKKSQTSDREIEFPGEPESETTPIEVYENNQTSDKDEITITFTKEEIELIAYLVKEEISYTNEWEKDWKTLQSILDKMM